MKTLTLFVFLFAAVASQAAETTCEIRLTGELPVKINILRSFFEQARESLKSLSPPTGRNSERITFGPNSIQSTINAWQADQRDSEIQSQATESLEASLQTAWVNTGPYSIEQLQTKAHDWQLNIELITQLVEFTRQTSVGDLNQVQFIVAAFNYAASEKISNSQMVNFAQKLWSHGQRSDLRVGTMVFGIFREEAPQLWGGQLPDVDTRVGLVSRLFFGESPIKKVDRVMMRIASLLGITQYTKNADSTFKKLVLLTLRNPMVDIELLNIESMVSRANPFSPGEIGVGAWQRLNDSRLVEARKSIDRVCLGLPALARSDDED